MIQKHGANAKAVRQPVTYLGLWFSGPDCSVFTGQGYHGTLLSLLQEADSCSVVGGGRTGDQGKVAWHVVPAVPMEKSGPSWVGRYLCFYLEKKVNIQAGQGGTLLCLPTSLPLTIQSPRCPRTRQRTL